MSWNEHEPIGILEHRNGFVVVGYRCARCDVHWKLELPQDDYSEEKMKTEKCYACSLRKRMADEIRHSRFLKRRALQIIREMETELDVLKTERENHSNLLESGAQIICQQDAVIRDLKNKLDRKSKKR